MLSNQIQVFQYNGSTVTFQKGNGNVMVNATEMAKPFEKNATHWLRNQSTQEFINELAALRNRNPTDLVSVANGGANYGTWMHEDVAMEFARWLSPKFAIRCNDRIKELLTTGVATVSNDDEMIARAMRVLQQRLTDSKQQLQIAQGTIEQQEESIKSLAPKATYTDEVLQSTSTFTLTQIAHDLGMRSVHVLVKILLEKGILFRQSGQLQPTAKVAGKGYFNTRTSKFIKKDDTIGTSLTTVVTEFGRQWLHSNFSQKGGRA